jgi:hypothetical protein
MFCHLKCLKLSYIISREQFWSNEKLMCSQLAEVVVAGGCCGSQLDFAVGAWYNSIKMAITLGQRLIGVAFRAL